MILLLEPGPSRYQQSTDDSRQNRELFQRIKETIPTDPETYADPAQLLQLPFPFLWDELPSDRFDISEAQFTYVGREMFKELWNKVETMRQIPHARDLFLCGTMGYGKSHILACIALLLIQKGEGVVYLPDCRALLGNVVPYVKAAMLLTFGDSPVIQQRVQGLRTMEDITDFFLRRTPLRKIFFIIDQFNALEPVTEGCRGDISNEEKDIVEMFLSNITGSHRRIRGAFANSMTIRHLARGQTNDIKIYVEGGLSEVSWGVTGLPGMTLLTMG